MKKEKEEKWFDNWDSVEVRERYHRNKAIEALKAATCVYAQTNNKKATRDFLNAIDGARRAGLTTTEIDAVIDTITEEERRKKGG